MNGVTITQIRQVIKMDDFKHLLKQYPEYITKEQFRIIAHISKQTARFLLTCGLIPCQHSGKKTRCYKIKLTDVIDYLESREQCPALYSPSNYPLFKEVTTGRRLAVNPEEYPLLREYLLTTLADYPDAMFPEDVARYTGFQSASVRSWANNGKLKYIPFPPMIIVPKEYLLDFLASKDGLNRRSRTVVFNDLINGFLVWKLKHRK